MKISIEPSWDKALLEEFEKPYFESLTEFVKEEIASGRKVYPPKGMTFNAFKATPFDKVKVVIVGQDPYHGEGQAHGLCFSVPIGVAQPPSLKNIFKEISADLGVSIHSHGSLEKWADQGVLLLNTVLTVRDGEPLSHSKKGWEVFTDAVIYALSNRKEPIVFLLWGRNAYEKCKHINLTTKKQHFILTAPHPSPLSAYTGFFGCKHFSKTNDILKSLNQTPIDWSL